MRTRDNRSRQWWLIAASIAIFAVGTAVGFAAGSRADAATSTIASTSDAEPVQVTWF